MYKYTINIIGMGCEVVAGELTDYEMKSLKGLMKESNKPLEDIIMDSDLLIKSNLGISGWYDLDDICHVYGAYPNMSRVKVISDEVKVYNPMELRTFIDDFYSLIEFDSIHSIMDEKGILVKSNLCTKEPFDPDLLTLLITKLEREDKPIYVITGFIYDDEYLKLETSLTEEVKLKTFINKTNDSLCII